MHATASDPTGTPTTIAYAVRIKAPVDRVFAFHADPANLAVSMPPGAEACLARRVPTLRPGTRVEVCFRVGPWSIDWTSRIVALEPNRLLHERMVVGPFRHWDHTLAFAPHPWGTRLTETLCYRAFDTPLLEIVPGALLHAALDHAVRQSLARRRELLERDPGVPDADPCC